MADWWARGIAIGGAAVAGLNMSVSYMTYRRMRPRVEVVLEHAGLALDASDPDNDDVVFSLRLLNRSATNVQVEAVEMWVQLPSLEIPDSRTLVAAGLGWASVHWPPCGDPA